MPSCFSIPSRREWQIRLVTSSFDYIMVGAGSAGCLLAGSKFLDSPAGRLFQDHGRSARDAPVQYRSGGTDGPAQRRVAARPRGRVLGGSSSINGLIYIRGQKEDYADWVAAGDEAWDYESVLPYFKRSENYAGGESRYHGASGELGVSDLQNDHLYCEAWLQAGQEIGLPFNPDFNGATDYGVGAYQLTIRDGWRSSASSACA